jgi:hypothetical protein
MEQVLTKRENWRRASLGMYGNRLRSWDSIEALRTSDWRGLVTVRTLLGGGGPCIYDMPVERAEKVSTSLGLPKAAVCFNQGAVDSTIRLQGEYLNDVVRVDGRTFDGVLRFSTVKLKMRDALRVEERTLCGLAARLALRDCMTPSSWADFEALLEIYPGHVLEVSTYEGTLGDLPGRNSIVWEIRKY